MTNNARSDNSLSLLHLYEFEVRAFAEATPQTLRFTDHDIYVNDGTYNYIPISISFDAIKENIKLESVSINLTIDNVSQYLSSQLLLSNWRGKKATITRVAFTPKLSSIDGEAYEFGYGDNLNIYPQLELADVVKDVYTVFDGKISSVDISEQSLSVTLSTQLGSWAKPFPPRIYDQREFNSLINAINDTIYWGRLKDI